MELNRQQKVLIIDDDDRNIFALKAVLQSRGFICVTAVSGQQALEIMQRQPDIGIALVDMMMPGMDGYELMERVKDTAALGHLRMVAVTAQAMSGDREKCLAAGADAYVSKPVNIEILLEVMSEPLNEQE
ncbi:MAG: response regulator [Chitinophagaceae bacterium]